MVQSIDRAMQIIRILESDDGKSGWPISDISEKVGLPLSTTHRLISSLVEHDLVAQLAETKRYILGPKWIELGVRQLDRLDLRTAARPVMERIAAEVKETVFLSIPNGAFSMGIDKIESPMKLRVVENLGERIAMNIGAPNKAMLANMDPREAEAILIKLIADKESRNKLLQSLPDIKRAGYCVSYAEMTEGTVAIAAPILGFGRRVIGAIGIGVMSYGLTEDRVAYLGKEIVAGAGEVTNKMGG